MNLSDILVLLDHTPASQMRLELAIGYAARHGAVLNAGIYQESGWSEDVRAFFMERVEDVGIDNLWWGDRIQSMPQLLHSCDLIIAGQTPQTGSSDAPSNLPEKLVLTSGRPVMTVPFAGRFIPRSERVLVAWSDGRESTRALHDAMPILMKAQKVHLIHLVTEASRIDGSEEHLSITLDHLKRSGVRAKGDLVLSIDFPPGDMLLNRACEERSDLLVMGAYSSTGGKSVLGAVAKHILKHMTLPVLMSH